MRRLSDKIMGGLFKNINSVLIGIVILIILIAAYQGYKYNQFMSECTQYHKAYECEVMWNDSQPKHSYIYLPN